MMNRRVTNTAEFGRPLFCCPGPATFELEVALARKPAVWRVGALHSSAMENFLARSRRSARLRAHLRKAEIDTARLEKRQHSKQGAGYIPLSDISSCGNTR